MENPTFYDLLPFKLYLLFLVTCISTIKLYKRNIKNISTISGFVVLCLLTFRWASIVNFLLKPNISIA